LPDIGPAGVLDNDLVSESSVCSPVAFAASAERPLMSNLGHY
jgi:hypothetical protein